ncbi:hypothetical protein E2C01_069657 [Portunus trituberculatus]|uniref:Uncharacterized protein n=1 Tax=Portunus trituberculatus TaxID=210409 RepID=A0A5B7HV50_PORTR|nr:hypothetical protein [Portunus trituberculatus]
MCKERAGLRQEESNLILRGRQELEKSHQVYHRYQQHQDAQGLKTVSLAYFSLALTLSHNTTRKVRKSDVTLTGRPMQQSVCVPPWLALSPTPLEIGHLWVFSADKRCSYCVP